MSNWLYKYFKEEIGPILFRKQGSYLVEPTLFSDNQSAAPTFWVQPPEPTIYLAVRVLPPLQGETHFLCHSQVRMTRYIGSGYTNIGM